MTYRDLAIEPLTHLSSSLFAARAAAPQECTPAQHREIDSSDAALGEFLAADVVVVGAPMYNFSIPSQLKAWIDRLAVAGKTFRYTSDGPQGLAGGKRVIIVSSRGGMYVETPLEQLDFQERVVRAEGVNAGAAGRETRSTWRTARSG